LSNITLIDAALAPSAQSLNAAADVPRANEGAELPLTIIKPRSGWQLVSFRELWSHRELIYFLVWRDIKIRYKQTVLGAAWAILQPFATMIVFTLFLGRFAQASPDGIPYPLYVYAGLLPWTFVANAVTSATNSIVGNQSLVTKIYFPRLALPIASVGAVAADFVIAFGMLVALMLYYGVVPGPGLLLIVPISAGLLATALAVGTLLAALAVAYRDVRHAIPFCVQLWMFATPTIYMDAPALLGERWQPFLGLNPAYGMIANFRTAMLGGAFDPYSAAASLAVAAATLLVATLYFRRAERCFADII
jgi:lipopolysaccharide transport system permease protein